MNRYGRELALLTAIIILCLLPVFSGPGFYTWATWSGLLLDNIPVLIAAVGVCIVIICAEIDISIAAQLAVCGVVAGLSVQAGVPLPLAVVISIACGALLGAVNALLIVVGGISSIIATLATWVIFEHMLLLLTEGRWIQGLGADWQWFGCSQTTALFILLFICLLVYLVCALLMRNSSWGRAFYAVGCDHESARRVGIPVPWVIASAFIITGALMGLAAICHYVRYPSIETGGGSGLELKVIAAVVIGGTLITGGRGNLLGTALGVILLGLIGTVLNFMDVHATWERAVQGLIILLAVCMDRFWARQEVDDGH